jgi:hypothetical protein
MNEEIVTLTTALDEILTIVVFENVQPIDGHPPWSGHIRHNPPVSSNIAGRSPK